MDFLTRFFDYSPLPPLANQIGITCLIAQVSFTLLFNKRTNILPDGPWTHLSAFTAHQIVSLPLMIVLSYCGWRDWFFDPEKYEPDITASHRIFGYSNPNDIPLAIASGAILLWDIPTSIISPPLRDRLMLAHHVGMFVVAYTMSGGFCKNGNQIGYYYAPFYFGVIEFSSVFLSYVDIFHPKYVHYHKWMNSKHGTLKKMINCANEVGRVLFALSFLALRGLYFPYISFRWAIPDIFAAYDSPPDGVPMWTGYCLIIMIAIFACLQAYWGLLIAKHAMKALRVSGEDNDAKIPESDTKKD
jgi:hypothetical protein